MKYSDLCKKYLDEEISWEQLIDEVSKNLSKAMSNAKCDCELDLDEDDVGLPKIFNGRS